MMVVTKKYSDFLKERHEDIDPYSEGNWNELCIQSGDEVVCKVDNYNLGGYYAFEEGKKYIIRDVIIYRGIEWVIVYTHTENSLGRKEFLSFNRYDFEKCFKKDDGINEQMNELDPYNEEDWNDSFNTVKDILRKELLYFDGKMISGSKSGYRRLYPDNLVIFNSVIYIDSQEAFGHCDLDLTKDFEKIKKIADDNDVVISVYPEMEDILIWRSDTGLNSSITRFYRSDTLTRVGNK